MHIFINRIKLLASHIQFRCFVSVNRSLKKQERKKDRHVREEREIEKMKREEGASEIVNKGTEETG